MNEPAASQEFANRPADAKKRRLSVSLEASRHLIPWLGQEALSLAFTTYQSGRLILIGARPDGGLSGFERHFDRAMGLTCTPDRMYLACKYQLWRLDNVLARGQTHKDYDALYVPRIGYTTGDLDVHDVVVTRDGRVVFACTELGCLATLSETNSCTPLWKPPFVSKIVNEDRCHLNGLALRDGVPRYVTCISQSDAIGGWRDHRADGGCVVDVQSDEVLVTGLSMPHSPRWYRGRLWLHNSGRGEFGWVDLSKGTFEPVAFCPGYLRGLAFHGDWAVMGLSRPREKTFKGLPLDGLLEEKKVDARCGVAVINLNTGAIAHTLWLEGVVSELYDVGVLPGVRRPMALGFHTDEIATHITLDALGTL